jgi:uncharacterized protein YggE
LDFNKRSYSLINSCIIVILILSAVCAGLLEYYKFSTLESGSRNSQDHNRKAFAQLFNFLGDNNISSSANNLSETMNTTEAFVPDVQIDTQRDITERTITVFGNATKTIKPDTVRVKLTVVDIDEDKKSALSNNSLKIRNVINTLIQTGLRENETQLQPLEISLDTDSNIANSANQTAIMRDPPAAETLRGDKYVISRSILITTHNLDRISDWVSKSVGSGVNRIDQVSFSLSNNGTANITESLLRDAIADGWSKAKVAGTMLDVIFNGTKGFELEDIVVKPSPSISLDIADASTLEEWLPLTISNVTVTADVSLTYLFQNN